MAKFFGTVQGGRGQATRLGHASTGLRVTAQSWDGSIVVQMYSSSKAPDDAYVRIGLGAGSTGAGGITLYDGPVSGLFADQNNFGR